MADDKKEIVPPEVTEETIKSKIYLIRGQRVMLDSDLAVIYGYATKDFNRQVRNNIEKFQPDFMFRLSKNEVEDLRCKNSTANISPMSRSLPYVFTEQGIYMLMTVLTIALPENRRSPYYDLTTNDFHIFLKDAFGVPRFAVFCRFGHISGPGKSVRADPQNPQKHGISRLFIKEKTLIKILFVCHGNICRSVSAQYILQNLVHMKKISDSFLIDSAATSTEEIGNPIYPPMRRALEKKNIPVGNHTARQLRKSDYGKYDLIIGMDEENMYYMKRILGDDPDHKIHYLMEYTDHPDEKIEDPWYTRRFLFCADQIEEGCRGLLNYLKQTVRLS